MVGIGGIGAIDPSRLAKSGQLDPSKATTGTVAESFAAALARAAGNTVDTLQNAEQVSIAGLQGKADARQVADAVMSAEQSLQAAIAIRDKIVTAYLEISRMGI